MTKSTNDQKFPQLRIVANDTCGRQCLYCRPTGEGCPTHKDQQTMLDDMVVVATAYTQAGGKNVKLTGGDPALYALLPELVRRLKTEAKVPSLEVLSRHPRMGKIVDDLVAAGVDQLNMSIDSLNAEKHKMITGVDDLPEVLKALKKCCETGLLVKVNTVLMTPNKDEIEPLIHYCEQLGITELKFMDIIRDMHDAEQGNSVRLKQIGYHSIKDLYVDCSTVYEFVDRRAIMSQTIMQGNLGHPMRQYVLPSGLKVTVKDHKSGAWYHPRCEGCKHYPCHDALMALRLTSDRCLQYCLLSDNTVNIATALDEGGASVDNVVRNALDFYNNAQFCEGA
jgi:cyclic pyranopterin phosphate synthase